MQKILEMLAGTAELMNQQISPNAAAMMANDLKDYKADIIAEALAKLRRDAKARFSLGAILEKIEELNPDGRPGAEEAWAMIPQDEYSSAVMTQEMAEAMGIDQPLLDAGDKIAARMSFKEAYSRIVDTNKRNGVRPTWFPSLGFEKSGHVPVLAEAVRLGRLSQDHALGLIAPEETESLLQLAGVENLALENKTSPENLKRLEEFKSRLSAMVSEK